MDWDKYFLQIAMMVGKQSKCFSRQIGVVLVRDRSIITTGFNGPPRGIPHCEERSKREVCPRRLKGYVSGKGLHLCTAAHAELNALLNAARMGACTKDTTLYCNCCVPCKNCLIALINAGIKEIVCTNGEYYDDLSPWLLKHSNIQVRVVPMGGRDGRFI